MRYSEMVAVEKERAATLARARAGAAPAGPILPGRMIWWFAGLALLIFALSGCTSAEYRDRSIEMTTAGKVDLTRYAGRWFEIARFPNRFEDGCVGVTADYSLNEDGSVRVLNTCRKGALDGPVETAEGVATIQRAEGDRLDVTFVPWLPFARGDYWILALDEAYQVAVIGNPAGTTGWILARTPELTPEDLEQAKAVLARNGYDTVKLMMVPQVPG